MKKPTLSPITMTLPLSTVIITAKEAQKIAVVTQRSNFQVKAEETLENIYKNIRTSASNGFLEIAFDLLGYGKLKGLAQAKEIKEIVIKALKEKGTG